MKSLSSQRFQNLAEDKQETIIRAAIKEFSEHGYENANTNEIAAKAGISVGSLFTYFENKRQLFLAVINIGAKKIEDSLNSVIHPEDTTEEKFEKLLRMILKTSREEQDLVRLYRELSSIGNKDLISPLAPSLETYSARTYEKLLDDGLKLGEVRSDIHLRMAAFHLDNIFVSLQQAYACDYDGDRYEIYVSEGISEKRFDDFVVSETMKVLRGAFLV